MNLKIFSTTIITFLLLLISSNNVYADTTGNISVDSLSSTTPSNQFTNPSNIYTSNNVYATKTGSVAGQIYATFPNLNIPSGADITRIDYIVEAYRDAGGSSPFQIGLAFHWNENCDAGSNLSGTNQSYATILTSEGQRSGYKVIESSDKGAGEFVPTQINNNLCANVFLNTNGSNNWYIDNVTINITYDCTGCTTGISTAEITDIEASASGQWTKYVLEGDTATSGADLMCMVTVQQKCISPSGVAEFPFTSIELSLPESTHSAQQVHPDEKSTFYGYNWQTTSGDSTWDSVIYGDYVPYQNCNVDLTTQCYSIEKSCETTTDYLGFTHTSCFMTNAEEISNFTQSQDIDEFLTTNVSYSEPEPDDPFQWIVWSFKKWFWETFSPQAMYSPQNYTYFKNQMNKKAPLAYVSTVFDLDLTTTASSSAVPLFNLSLVSSNITGGDPISYSFTDPDDIVSSATVLIKNATKLLLYVIFLFYLYKLPTRIFSQ